MPFKVGAPTTEKAEGAKFPGAVKFMVTVAPPDTIGTAPTVDMTNPGGATMICATATVVLVFVPGGDQARQRLRVLEAP